MIEEDDPGVLCNINEGHELTHDKFLIFKEFPCLVWVCKKYCCFGSDSPFTMGFDRFICLGPNAHMVDGDVNVSD